MIITGQQWRDLKVPALGEWEPTLRVCVVIPAHGDQPALDRTLAALSGQTYPEHLTEVVVVDDASPVPLAVTPLAPRRTRVLRAQDAGPQGPGRARDRGARHTDADVILFLDSDMIVDRWHVEAHARWHHVCPYAVVLGRKWFVEVEDISADDVAQAVPADGLEALLDERPRKGHTWQENFIRRRGSLTRDLDDTFVAVVGADVSAGRRLYQRSGGFAPFVVRGIEDVEFGYRAFTSGGLIIPDDEARAYHQGARTFASKGDAIKRERLGLVANHIPIPMFRTFDTGRRWAVPRVHAIVTTGAAPAEDVLLTVESLLGSTFTDLHVEIAGATPDWLRDYYGHEQRVTVRAEASRSVHPAPIMLHVSPGVLVNPTVIERAVDRLSGTPALHAELTGPGPTPGGLSFTMRTTRSFSRAQLTGDEPPEPLAVDAGELGLERTVHHVTPQGMIAPGPLSTRKPSTPAGGQQSVPGSGRKPQQLSIPARARRKARHLLRRGVRRIAGD